MNPTPGQTKANESGVGPVLSAFQIIRFRSSIDAPKSTNMSCTVSTETKPSKMITGGMAMSK